MLAFVAGAVGTLAFAASIAARALPEPRASRDRAAAASLVALFAPVLVVRVLGALTALSRESVALSLVAAGVLGVALVGPAARAQIAADARRAWTVARGAFGGGAWSLGAWVGAA